MVLVGLVWIVVLLLKDRITIQMPQISVKGAASTVVTGPNPVRSSTPERTPAVVHSVMGKSKSDAPPVPKSVQLLDDEVDNNSSVQGYDPTQPADVSFNGLGSQMGEESDENQPDDDDQSDSDPDSTEEEGDSAQSPIEASVVEVESLSTDPQAFESYELSDEASFAPGVPLDQYWRKLGIVEQALADVSRLARKRASKQSVDAQCQVFIHVLDQCRMLNDANVVAVVARATGEAATLEYTDDFMKLSRAAIDGPGVYEEANIATDVVD